MRKFEGYSVTKVRDTSRSNIVTCGNVFIVDRVSKGSHEVSHSEEGLHHAARQR